MSPRLTGPLACIVAVVAVTLGVKDPGGPSPDGRRESPAASEAVQESAGSLEDFCASHTALQLAFGSFTSSPSVETLGHLKGVVVELQASSPADLPPDAARGLMFVVEALTALKDDAGPEDLGQIDSSATRQDTIDATALGDYVAANCQIATPAA